MARQHTARQIGVDALDRIFLIENHDEAFYIWRDAGISKRTLLHIDAHHDMWWTDDETPITIANFVCSALKQDLLQEVFWIVPDATFQNVNSRKPVLQHLKRILREYPGKSTIDEDDRRITASVLGKRLMVCPLRLLPALHEPVLLDIDVDYFVIPRVAYGEPDQHVLLPWCWPNELVRRLNDAGVQSDLVTIAYSVEGGYTPLQWKYLGQELVLLLKEPLGASTDIIGMECLRQGAEAEQRGQAVIAESKYRQARATLPSAAAAPHRLARLLANLGRVNEARQFYAQAVRLDASYESAYSSSGFHSYWRGDLRTAEREFQRSLTLNPSDANAQLGLGLLAQKRKCWNEADQHLRAALALDDCLLDAQRALGDVMAKLGRTNEAILAFEQALKLGLMGHKPLEGPILTYAKGKPLLDPLLDPWHFGTHARLANLYARKGATQKAIDGLRMSMAGRFDSARLRLQLARLYWRQGRWRNFAGQCWQAIRMAPKDIYWSSRAGLQRVLRLAERPWALGNGRQ
jgi:tetratricopeptide (TPR) repeat protein